MLHHRGTTQKLKHMRDNCDQRVRRVDKDEVQNKSRHLAIQFLLPAVCCDSNKSRCQVGYIMEEGYVPGSLVADEDWFTPGAFDEDEERTAQADLVDSKNIATFFISFESGHSNQAEVQHEDFDHTQYPCRYLLHGTNERNLNSIRQGGLLPGGTRGTRKGVHFVLDHTLTTLTDSLRPESDCILVYKLDALQDLQPRITNTLHVLTHQVVLPDRILGIWSLTYNSWIQKPTAAEFARMDDPHSDIDLMSDAD